MDDFLQLRENVLCIPGLTGEHTVLQISDCHLCVTDPAAPEEENAVARERELSWQKTREYFARRYGERWGDAQKLSTREAFLRMLDFARSLSPELLLITGDVLEFPHEAGRAWLTGALASYPGNWLCLPGNHEPAELPGLWPRGVQVYRGEGFTVAAADDREKTVSDETLAALRALAKEETPILAALHVPVATAFNRIVMGQFEDYFVLSEDTADANGRALVEFLRDDDTVRAVLCGHVHGYCRTDLFPGKPQFCCSAGMSGNAHLLRLRG